MAEDLNRSYKEELHRALEKYQFIEETLKMSLIIAIEIARIQVLPYFPINYKKEEINKLSLGSLVNAFAKFNDDKMLHKDLREIAKERNHVAHQSLLFTIGEYRDESFMENEISKMKKFADRAAMIHKRILDVRSELLEVLSKVKRFQKRVS